METQLIEGVAMRADDARIMDRLEEQACPCGRDSKRMLIGVRGPTGDVYRVVEVDGVDDWMSAVDVFSKAGLSYDGEAWYNGRVLDATFR